MSNAETVDMGEMRDDSGFLVDMEGTVMLNTGVAYVPGEPAGRWHGQREIGEIGAEHCARQGESDEVAQG